MLEAVAASLKADANHGKALDEGHMKALRVELQSQLVRRQKSGDIAIRPKKRIRDEVPSRLSGFSLSCWLPRPSVSAFEPDVDVL